YWNWFDLVVILSGIGEEVLSGVILRNSCESPRETGDVMTAFTVLRVMRLLRITRLIRAVRFMPIFRELRVMVRSILNCLMPLIWCIVLLGFFQWCFAVYFITVSSDHVQAMHYFPERYSHLDQTRIKDQIKAMFGSLWRTNYVLFMSVSGGLDWGYASDIFIELESYYAAAGYLFFIALVALAVLNVVTAVFVEYAMKMAADDRDLVIQDTLAKRNKYMQDAMLVFKEADADGSGSITYKEFLDHVEDERVQAFLNSMELDGIEAIRLFKLLDLDGSGSVEPDEFVHGCMCLKGMAKTMDLAILLREQRKAMQTWGSFMSYVDICLTQLLKEDNRELPVMSAESSKSRPSLFSGVSG
ncbi:CCR3, partial [Symbiodinium sp. KB8]